ncbi:fimbrial biogenesis chaperone [Sphingomonas sp. AX6]|uniref:fimbrial biogenesis chaperone n=1 Tax=Sphingomonas sp. AX6 TaxID=2653171 RepID=UPI001F338A57|nr:fimbria/pilus periplasmic chaperone [Sphingomonas sp. AX6]
MTRWPARIAAVFIMVGALATGLSAMRVSPMVVEMETTGGNATARVEVQNINKSNLPFETRVTLAEFKNDGTIAETAKDEDFLVFPPQGLLPPNGRQVMRLQWVGGALEESRAYYLSVNQLPVQLEENTEGGAGAQVQVLYNMKALVIVAPPGAQPDVSVVSARAEPFQPPAPPQGGPVPEKVPGIAVTLRNTGKRHAMMSGLTWLIDGKDNKGTAGRLILTPEDLAKGIGTGYIAAGGGERTFRIATNVIFGNEPLTVRFQQP